MFPQNQQNCGPIIFCHRNDANVSSRKFLTPTYFTVKSADSGIQNSSDGSREVLTNVPADNNLPEAGRTSQMLTNSQIGISTSVVSD